MRAMPPSPPGLPVIGHLAHQLSDPLGFLTQVARDYPGVSLLRLGPINAFYIQDPDDIERVLVSDARNYTKDRFMRDLRRVVGQGLLTSEGDFWRRQRRLAQPAFHRQRIRGYGEAMVASTQTTIASWQPGQVRDLREEMMALTLDVVGRTLFSSTTRDSAEQVGHAMEIVMERYASPVFLIAPALDRLPLPHSIRFRRAVTDLDRLVRGIIAGHRASGSDQGDLLSMLLAARDEDGSAMDEEQVRDEVITLFLAGHETTALALCWAFWLLSQHPDVDARLHQELSLVLGGRLPQADDVPRLTYTESIILETLRLYPPAWTIGREVSTETQLGPYRVLPGEQIITSQWVIHRQPRFFPDPDRFYPERWADGLQKRLPRFAYFPFGGGPRLCIGNNFAMMEAILLLATIAQRFRLSLLPGQYVTPFASITLRPQGSLRARLVAR
jgi:cytochrome P450